MTEQEAEKLIADAKAMVSANRIDEAAVIYKGILVHRPADPLATHGLCIVAVARGEFDEAERLYRSAIANDSSHGILFSGLGTILLLVNRVPEAIECFERALLLDPLMVDTRLNLGAALYRNGDYVAAHKLFQEMALREPADKRVKDSLARLDADPNVIRALEDAKSGEEIRLSRLERNAEDEILVSQIIASVQKGEIAAIFDYKKLGDASSPVAIDFLSTVILYGFCIFSGALYFYFDAIWVTAILSLMLVFYAALGLRLQRRTIDKIILNQIRNDASLWSRLWNYGGLMLKHIGSAEECTAPKGDWRAFASGLQHQPPRS